MATRLYLFIAKKRLNVKGVTYSRAETPVMYWVELVLTIIGATMILGIAALLAINFAGWAG